MPDARFLIKGQYKGYALYKAHGVWNAVKSGVCELAVGGRPISVNALMPVTYAAPFNKQVKEMIDQNEGGTNNAT